MAFSGIFTFPTSTLTTGTTAPMTTPWG